MFDRWPIGSLIKKHVGGGTPPRGEARFWGGSVPWASVKDFEDDVISIDWTEERITQEGLRASTSNLVPAGVPLVCTRMAVGRVACSEVPVAINQDVRALFPREGIDNRYLLRLLSSLQTHAEARSVGSTVKGIRTSDYLALVVPVAPANEQPLIASILDTLDTKIHQTEALIGKLEQIKQGLLTDLLTRGIDENGELRPSFAEAPHLYKESKVGLIPTAWSVSSVGVEFSVSSGFTLGAHRAPRNHPRPFLRVGNVFRDRIDLSEVSYLDANQYEYASRKLARGDLLVVEGHANPNEIGRCAMVTEEVENFTFQNHLFRLQPLNLLTDFGLLWMNSAYIRAYWRRSCGTSSGLNTINRSRLESAPVVVPPVEEQVLIRDCAKKIQLKLEAERNTGATLCALKSGLAFDLLAGHVRVTPLIKAHEKQAAG